MKIHIKSEGSSYAVIIGEMAIPTIIRDVTLSDLNEMSRVAADFVKLEIQKAHAAAVYELLSDLGFAIGNVTRTGNITATHGKWVTDFELTGCECPRDTARRILLAWLSEKTK